MDFEEIMRPYAEKYKMHSITFRQDSQTGNFISAEDIYDENDEPVIMLIRMTKNVGAILIGISPDGETFIEEKFLGQIMLTDEGWINI